MHIGEILEKVRRRCTLHKPNRNAHTHKSDYQFLYVRYKAIQKLESYRSVQFCSKAPELHPLTKEIVDNHALLQDMATPWADGPGTKSSTRGEKRMAALIDRLQVIFMGQMVVKSVVLLLFLIPAADAKSQKGDSVLI